MLGKKLEIEVKLKLTDKTWGEIWLAHLASADKALLVEYRETIHLYHHKDDGSSERLTFVHHWTYGRSRIDRVYFLVNTKTLDPATGFYNEEESVTTADRFFRLLHSDEKVTVISKIRQVIDIDSLEYEIDHFEIPALPYKILEIEFSDMAHYESYMGKIKEEGRLPESAGSCKLGTFPLVEDVTFDPAYRNIVLSVPKSEVDVDVIASQINTYLYERDDSEDSFATVEE